MKAIKTAALNRETASIASTRTAALIKSAAATAAIAATSRSIPNANAALSKVLAILAVIALIMGALLPANADLAYGGSRDDDILGNRTLGESGLLAINVPSIEAEYAYVIDDAGTVYFERNSNAESKIASITKVMTALVALESAPLDTKMTVSHAAATVGESTSKLQAGDIVELGEALEGLMLPSGNDAAIVIAENIGHNILESKGEDADDASDASNAAIVTDTDVAAAISGDASASVIDGENMDAGDDPATLAANKRSYDAFVEAMNEKAAELGCSNTLFTNPHGLDIDGFEDDLHSSAKDVAIFAKAAMEHPEFAQIVCQPKAEVVVERGGQQVAIEVESTDLLLESYDKARGIKTGFTSTAGSCFVGAAEDNGQMVYAVVLGSPTDSQRFVDSKALCEWVFNSKVEYPLANSDVTAHMKLDGEERDVPVVAYAPLAAWLDKTVPVTFSDPDAKIDVSSIFGNISQGFEFAEISGAIHEGDVVGKASFFQDNESITTVDLVACEDVEAPNLFETISIMWQRLTNGLSGDSRMAESYIINSTPLLLEKA